MKRLIIEQSNDEFYTSHSGQALAGACINRHSDLGRQVGRLSRGGGHIADIDILRSYLGLLCLGKSDFQAIAGVRDDDFFQQALGIGPPPLDRAFAAATGRDGRRWSDPAGFLQFAIHAQAARRQGLGLGRWLVPLDVDVFPQDNSNTRKEGVSRTYKNFDGYAPIAAYLGMEGWCLEVELRPGSQHGQAGFVVFIQRVIKAAHVLIEQEILVRLDAAHDAEETRQVLAAAENVRFLIKWNPRNSNELTWRDRVFSEGTVTTPRAGKLVGLLVVDEPMQVDGSAYPCKRIVRVTERTTDRHGQLLLTPDITLEGWWTDLDMEPEQVIALYRDHATSEQFHSEFKTDLDLERLPSGKFAPIRHPAKRRRIRRVIQELIYLAVRLISMGRRLILPDLLTS